MAKRRSAAKRATEPAEDKGAPTKERRRHGKIIEVRPRGGGVTRIAQPPIARYLARDQISRRQHQAGERLAVDYELGILGARDPERHGASGPPEPITIARLMAATSYREAVQALGPVVGAIVVPICCAEMTAGYLADRLQRSTASIMGSLRSGLEELADHYGY